MNSQGDLVAKVIITNISFKSIAYKVCCQTIVIIFFAFSQTYKSILDQDNFSR